MIFVYIEIFICVCVCIDVRVMCIAHIGIYTNFIYILLSCWFTVNNNIIRKKPSSLV